MATSIDYPTDLPCPATAGNVMTGGKTFDRSTFDYNTRQRETYTSDYILSFAFVARAATEMEDFRDFYYNTLTKGVLSFNATWEVEGSTVSKEFRFAERYTSSSISGGQYRIQCSFEMLTPIDDL